VPQDRTPARTRAEANNKETKQFVRRVRRVTRRKVSLQEKAAVIALVRGSPPESEHGYSVDENRGRVCALSRDSARNASTSGSHRVHLV
jgi:hypothetical protein